LYYILLFPFNIYGSFILEHKFCLTKQKISDWFKDQLKAGILSYIISLIIFGAFYHILRHNPNSWWLVVSVFWITFSLILAKLTPVFIIPLFFKCKPLTDNSLRERIINLSQKMKVKILDVFEIDFSKKTLKANAAFVGWGSTRRVLLADTLKDKYSHDEIEVILAHEFAHYQMKHLLKLIIINALSTVAGFYLIFKTNIFVLNIFGLSSLEDFAAFPVVVMYLMVFGIITQPLGNYISRVFEKEADTAAIKITGFKEAFILMMEKLSNQNLSDRSPHPIIKFFFFNHPPTDERINMAKTL
jgi:STE24 endopeptidase